MSGDLANPPLGHVLVIGGCGFLGHHVVRQLVERWNPSQVSVIDVRCQRNRIDGVNYVDASITDAEALNEIFVQLEPDIVIHTASPPAQGNDKVQRDVYYEVNVRGTEAVVEACKVARVKALVYTSSASIMSDNRSDLINANEAWPIIRGRNQTEYYSETKAEAESIVLAANRSEPSNLLTASIRPSGIFGEGDVQTVYQALKVLGEGKDKWQVGENENLFDFTYVGNVAHAHVLAARALIVTHASPTMPLDYERIDGEAFIITNGEPVYFWDFMRAMWAAAGSKRRKQDVWVLPSGLGYYAGWASELAAAATGRPAGFTRQRITYSVMTRYFDISKARRRLRYTPLTSLSDGVRRAARWALDEKWTVSEKASLEKAAR